MPERIMWDKKRTNIKAIFWSRLSHIDLIEGKKLQHDDELKKLFSAVCYSEPEIEIRNFDKRVEEVKSGVKV